MLLRHPFATFEEKLTFSSSIRPNNRVDFAQLACNGFLRSHRPKRRQRLIFMQQSGDAEKSGQEPPESLFMKELKRRGIPPTSRQDKRGALSSSGTESISEVKKETEASTSQGSYAKRISELNDEQRKSNQRQQSMALNSEGLEGLVPRARALLALGGSFILSFWPLFLSSLVVFVALYIYYGPAFIHFGNHGGGGRASYVEPYELLNKERVPSEIDPSFAPDNMR